MLPAEKQKNPKLYKVAVCSDRNNNPLVQQTGKSKQAIANNEKQKQNSF